MTISFRTAVEADWPSICKADGRAFGSTWTPDDMASARTIHEIDRFEVALEGSEVVGVCGAYSLLVTMPGGAQLPMGGLTWVSTAATHRRQGVLTELMARSLADVDRRGEPVAMLYASEGGIYERYGFGTASQVRETTIDRRHTQLLPEFRPAPGTTRFVDGDAALAHIGDVWARFHGLRAGEIDRSAAWHRYMLSIFDKPKGSFGSATYLAHDDGYAIYRIEQQWNDGHPAHTMLLVELVAVTAQAHIGLWHTLLGVDLVGPIVSRQVPIDDPLPYLLTNPRAVQTTAINDGLWVNVRDVARCFAARNYGTDDRLVIEVDGQRWAIDGGATGAACTRVRTRPDLVMDHPSIGALLLGGVRPSQLVAGRRVQARNADAVRRADAFFATSPAPHCQSMF
jgi:predicted acetyltransferase